MERMYIASPAAGSTAVRINRTTMNTRSSSSMEVLRHYRALYSVRRQSGIRLPTAGYNCWIIQVSVFYLCGDTFNVHVRSHRPPSLCNGAFRPRPGAQVCLLFPFRKAYHVSKERYNIATVDRGENAMIKVWSARRTHYYPQDRVSSGFLQGEFKIFIDLLVRPRIPHAQGLDCYHLGFPIDCGDAETGGEVP